MTKLKLLGLGASILHLHSVLGIRKLGLVFALFIPVTAGAFEELKVASARAVRMEPKPSYSLTKDQEDLVQLTDGKVSPPIKWLKKSTVGWQDAAQILLDFELVNGDGLRKICIASAAADYAAVSYPRIIRAYVSTDGVRYTEFGTVSPLAIKTKNALLPYSEQEFCLEGDVPGKYVVVVVRPEGKYFFTDEIEFRVADKSIYSRRNDSSPTRYFSRESIAGLSTAADIATTFKKAIQSNSPTLPGSKLNAIYEKIDHAFEVAGTLEKLESLLDGSNLSALLYPGMADTPKSSGSPLAGLVPRQFDPFSDLPVYASKKVTQTPWAWEDPVLVDDELAYASVVVDNPSDWSANIRAQAVGFDDALEVEMFDVRPVLSKSGGLVSDAVIPHTGSTKFYPWQSKQFIMSFRHVGDLKKRFQGNFILIDADTGKVLLERPIAVQTIQVPGGPKREIEITNWFYTNSVLLKNNLKETLKELDRGHVSLLMLSPWELFAASTRGTINVLPLRSLNQLSHLEQDRFKYGIFVGANDGMLLDSWGTEGCRTPSFEEAIGNALTEVRRRLNRLGISDRRIFVYPVDEPDSAAEFVCVEVITKVSKRRLPEVQTFITLGSLEGERLRDAIQEIDAFFVLDKQLASDAVREIRRNQRDLWVYSAEGGGKSSSADDFYLGLAWRAIENHADGLGIWTLADPENDGSPWNDFDGRRPDFGLVYFKRSAQNLVPSKRSLAWSQGVSDFFVMLRVDRKAVENCMKNEDRGRPFKRGTYSSKSFHFRQCVYDLYN